MDKQEMQEFENKQAEYLKEIPTEFHSFITQRAWDEGHAYGYEEVLIHVQALAFSLKPAIEKFRIRIA